MQECLFCNIVAGKIPSRKVFEDEHIFAFHDVRPIAPVHLLVIPKEHIATLYDAGMEQHAALGKMLAMAGQFATDAGATDGFRTVINCGRVGHQEVYHLHMHIIGGPDPLGPMIAKGK